MIRTAIAVALALAMAAPLTGGDRRCGVQQQRRQVHRTYQHRQKRIVVKVFAFPAPAVGGSTIYGYAYGDNPYYADRGGLLYLNAANRHLELARLLARRAERLQKSAAASALAQYKPGAGGGGLGKAEASKRVFDIVQAKCLRCHNPQRDSGGLDMSNLAELDRSYEAKIITRIKTDDTSLRMPLGGKLSDEEIAAFEAAISK